MVNPDDLEDQVFGFGSGKRGQLGVSDDKVKSVAIPQVTLGLENLKINSIIANGDHSAAICGKSIWLYSANFSVSCIVILPNWVNLKKLLLILHLALLAFCLFPSCKLMDICTHGEEALVVTQICVHLGVLKQGHHSAMLL